MNGFCGRVTARCRPLASAWNTPVGTASLSHRPSTSTRGRGSAKPGRFEHLGLLLQPPYQAVTDFERSDRPQHLMHSFWHIAQTMAHTVVQPLLLQKRCGS